MRGRWVGGLVWLSGMACGMWPSGGPLQEPPPSGVVMTYSVGLDEVVEDRCERAASELRSAYPDLEASCDGPVLHVGAQPDPVLPGFRGTVEGWGYRPLAAGTDLSGAWVLTDEADLQLREKSFEQVLEVVRERAAERSWIEPLGHTDIAVYLSPGSRESVGALLGLRGVLGMYEVDEALSKAWPSELDLGSDRIMRPASEGPLVLVRVPMVRGEQVASAEVRLEEFSERPQVWIELDEAGKRGLAEGTARIVGSRLAIVVDGTVVMAPKVLEPITGGRAVIDLGVDQDAVEADNLAAALRSGAFSSPLQLESVETYGP